MKCSPAGDTTDTLLNMKYMLAVSMPKQFLGDGSFMWMLKKMKVRNMS